MHAYRHVERAITAVIIICTRVHLTISVKMMNSGGGAEGTFSEPPSSGKSKRSCRKIRSFVFLKLLANSYKELHFPPPPSSVKFIFKEKYLNRFGFRENGFLYIHIKEKQI